jgi:hypothetical protein
MTEQIERSINHILMVAGYCCAIATKINMAGVMHDRSKLLSPEKEGFEAADFKAEFGTYEYAQKLIANREVIDMHYQANRHHPEHFENGIEGMTLVDLIEMFCDWLAASKLRGGGSFENSLLVSKDRFGLTDQLINIFRNTAIEIFNEKEIAKVDNKSDENLNIDIEFEDDNVVELDDLDFDLEDLENFDNSEFDDLDDEE